MSEALFGHPVLMKICAKINNFSRKPRILLFYYYLWMWRSPVILIFLSDVGFNFWLPMSGLITIRSVSKTNFQKLESVQNTCLPIALHTFHISTVIALCVRNLYPSITPQIQKLSNQFLPQSYLTPLPFTNSLNNYLFTHTNWRFIYTHHSPLARAAHGSMKHNSDTLKVRKSEYCKNYVNAINTLLRICRTRIGI